MKLLILLVVGYLLYRSFKSWFLLNAGAKKTPVEKKARDIEDVMVKDPVCEVFIPKREAIHLQAEGKNYYFCSDQCKDVFLEKRMQGENREFSGMDDENH
jgi:YHS domain-containing protein